jgi:hypothetical protein
VEERDIEAKSKRNNTELCMRIIAATIIDSLQNDHIEIKNRHAEILGAPIGATEQDIIDGLRQLSYRNNLHHFFKRLINSHLSVQAAMLLLIKCGVPKLSYLLRCVPPTCISAYAAEMDGQVLNCASKLLKLSDTDMKKSKIIQQLQSPISYGFGLISAVESSHVAYLSSVVSCLSMKTLKQYLSCSSVSSSSHPTSSPSSLSSSPTEPSMLYQHLEQCIITIKQNLIVNGNQTGIRSDLLPSSVSQIISHYQQHHTVIPILHSEVTSQIYKHRFKNNVTNAQQNGDSREAARMLAVSAYGASVWKTTTPSTVQSTLSDTHYQIAAKLALGVPPVSLPSDCSSCHKADACETDPFHPLSCNSQKGREITLRHDSVVNDLHHGIKAAGGVCIKEPSRLGSDGDNSRPDLQVVIGGEQVLVDVTIGNPTCQTYQDQCSEEQLKCTVMAEQRKNNKYSAMAETQNAKFIPFAVEMYGGLGKSAKKLLNKISKCARDQMLMWPYHRIIQNLKGEIAISIQRGNAIAILAGYNRAIGKPAKLHMGRGDAAA